MLLIWRFWRDDCVAIYLVMKRKRAALYNQVPRPEPGSNRQQADQNQASSDRDARIVGEREEDRIFIQFTPGSK